MNLFNNITLIPGDKTNALLVCPRGEDIYLNAFRPGQFLEFVPTQVPVDANWAGFHIHWTSGGDEKLRGAWVILVDVIKSAKGQSKHIISAPFDQEAMAFAVRLDQATIGPELVGGDIFKATVFLTSCSDVNHYLLSMDLDYRYESPAPKKKKPAKKKGKKK